MSVLIIGLDPFRVPGYDPAAVRAALDAEQARLDQAGLDAVMCLVPLDEGDEAVDSAVVAALVAREWEVVVIGAGIRRDDELLELFERTVNLVHQHAPSAAIAFNASLTDCLQAVRRWL